MKKKTKTAIAAVVFAASALLLIAGMKPEFLSSHHSDVFINKTKDCGFFVVGKGGETSGSYAVLVQPGKKSPEDFFADFFKCNGSWYKTGVLSSYVTGRHGGYKPHHYSRHATPDESGKCEEVVREYWKKRDQFRFAAGGEE